MNRAQRRKALDDDLRQFHQQACARPGKDDRAGMVGLTATLVAVKLESLRLQAEFEKGKRKP